MEDKIRCQSCGMPLPDASNEYCSMCFRDGAFTEPDLTLEGMIMKSVHYMTKNMNYTEDEAREMSTTVISKLKRWQTNS